MPDAKGWFPRSGVERFKEEAGGGRRVVRWVPTGDKRVEYTTHGDQMAEWRSGGVLSPHNSPSIAPR